MPSADIDSVRKRRCSQSPSLEPRCRRRSLLVQWDRRPHGVVVGEIHLLEGVVLPCGSDVEGFDEPIGDGAVVGDAGDVGVGDADGVGLLSVVRATASAGW